MSKCPLQVTVILVLCSCCLPSLASSETITLRDFLVRYLRTDKELDASALKLQASEKTMKAKRHVPYPSLRMSLTSPSYSWKRTYDHKEWAGQTYRGYYQSESRFYTLSLTLKQMLPTGGNLSVRGSADTYRSKFSSVGFPAEMTLDRETGDRQFQTDVGISVDQPLFGLWERRNEVRKASLEHEKARAQHKLESASAVMKAVNIFFDYLVGISRLEIEEKKLDRAKSNVNEAQRQFEEGLIPETELLQKRIEENDTRIAYLDAQIQLEREKTRLEIVSPGVARELVPEDLMQATGFKALGLRVETSPEVVQAKYDIEISRIALAETRRRRFGQPSLSLWYGLQGLGDGFSEAADEFGRNRWGGSFSVGLSLPEPGLGSDVDMARATLKAAEARYDEALQAATQEHERLTSQASSLRSNIELRMRQVTLLEDLVRSKREQFAQDLVSVEDLIESEIDLLSARISLLETMRKLNLTWVDLVLREGENPVERLIERN